MNSLTLSESGLIQQGYVDSPTTKLKNISNGLRFTPTLCMALAIVGLITQATWIHFSLAALGIIPFWFPSHHPFDILYNQLIRKIIRAEKLPPNPLQRRIACVMGGLMNILIGISFVMSNATLAYLFGGILITLQLIVITTHFCIASWMYEYALKLFGVYPDQITVQKAKSLLSKGAIIIDVRNKIEYQKGHINGAKNIPLEVINEDFPRISQPIILYCKGGMRSSEATRILLNNGHTDVYNLGSIDKWE